MCIHGWIRQKTTCNNNEVVRSSDEKHKKQQGKHNITIKTSKSYSNLKEVINQASRLKLTEHVIMAPNQKHNG